jgi:hypothetical protein
MKWRNPLNSKKSIFILIFAFALVKLLVRNFQLVPLIASRPKIHQTTLDSYQKAQLNRPKKKKKNSLKRKKNLLVSGGRCWRRCPQRINRMYYDQGAAAGLGDRMYIIGQLAQIAGYLCARLELPPPSIMLSSHHNNGFPVSNDLNWKDFRKMTFTEDKSSIFVDQNSSSFDRDFTGWHRIPVYDPKRYSDWLHKISIDREKIMEDYEMLQEFSWQHQQENSTTGFIWEIHMSYYHSGLFKQALTRPSEEIRNDSKYHFRMKPAHHYYEMKGKVNGCNYITQDAVPADMKLLRERIIDRVLKTSLQNSVFGYFHIRRGDAIHECDSSLPVLRNFLKCSLNGTEQLGKNITILLGSDEIDQSYRKRVLDLSKDYSYVKIVDADKITKHVLENALKSGFIHERFRNNFYIYELQKVLRHESNFSSFFLDKHRGNCPDCAPLVQMLDKHFGHSVT